LAVMKSFINDIVKRLITSCGFYHIKYLIKSRGKTLLILMYHDVVEEGSTQHKQSLVNRDTNKTFEANLKALKGFRILSLEDAVAEIRQENELIDDTIAITFDDGYRGVYDYAYPLLREYNIPATVFLTNDWINGKMVPWWEELELLVKQTDFGSISWENIYRILNITSNGTPIRFDNSIKSKKKFIQLARSILMKLCDDDRTGAILKIKEIFLEDQNVNLDDIKALSWDQIIEMSGNNIFFGAHTCSHLNLSFADLATAEEEIVTSKSEIECKINGPVKGFAYPYGYDYEGYNKFRPILGKIGFDYAVTAYAGYNYKDTDLYRLYRSAMPPSESVAIARRLYYLGLST